MKKGFACVFLGVLCIFGALLFPNYATSKVFAESGDFLTKTVDGGVCIVGVKPSAVNNGVLSIPKVIGSSAVVVLGRYKGQTWSDDYIKLFDASITSLDLSEAQNLSFIEKICFKSDSSQLTGSLHLPESLERIESGAFSNTNIKDLYIPDTTTCITLGSACFDSVEHFYFKSNSTLQLYKNAENWNTYADKMQVLSTIKTIALSFENIAGSEQRVVGKSYSYRSTTNGWEIDSDYSFPTPTRDMYDFVGWSADGTNIVTEQDIVPDVESITLRAIWSERRHSITYVCDFSTDGYATSFVESQGYNLPIIDSENISFTWDGWYLDEDCTQKTTQIAVGTNSDITVYAKKIMRNMAVGIQLSKYNYLYGETIELNAILSGIPDHFQTQTAWYIYDGSWKELESALTSTLNPATYNIRCVVTVSYNGQAQTLKDDSAVVVEKHKVSVTWDDTDSYTFTNAEIIPNVIANCDTMSNACRVVVRKYQSEVWVESEMFDAGLYEICVEPLHNYVEIVGTATKQYVVKPFGVELGYTKAYTNLTYGDTLVPEITTYAETCGFKREYVKEQIYIKNNNSWYDYSSRTLADPATKLKSVTNVGRYEFRLIMQNSNYVLTGTYQRHIVEIDKQVLNVIWDNISFEYDGYEHVPTATATNNAGENVQLIVTGGKVQANTQETPVYVATATLYDVSYTLQNPTTDFTISKTYTYITADYVDERFYDGEKSKISAVVRDRNGVLADNVAMFCATDLTSVGIHEVRLTWSGDTNHFPAEELFVLITIKTQNILYGEEDSPKLAIESTEGFDTINEVVVNEKQLETLNLKEENYNDITALYDVKSIYTLTSLNTRSVSLNMAMPENVKDISDITVLKVNADGSVEKIKYVVVDGRIKILASETNATYMLLVEKDNSSTTIFILLVVGLVCGTLTAVCLLSLSRRKHKKTNNSNNK